MSSGLTIFCTCRSFGLVTPPKISTSTFLDHQCGLAKFKWGRVHRMLKVSILDMSLKIIDLRLQHLPRVNELTKQQSSSIFSEIFYLEFVINIDVPYYSAVVQLQWQWNVKECHGDDFVLIDYITGWSYDNLMGPFYWPSLTLILAWISNYIHYKMRDEIRYPFPNFNGATIEVWKWMNNFIPHFTGHVITYPCWD